MTLIESSFTPKNRTNVRFDDVSLQLLRTALRGMSVVAPGVAERAGVEVFCRPRRRSVSPPAVEGLAATKHTVVSGSYRIAAWSWGEGPTVLLVHGWEGRAKQLTPFVAPLVDAGYRVVAFDQPAHGQSTGARMTVIDMARAVRDVAEDTAPLVSRRGLVPAPLHGIVAHSLGAAAAALALHQGLEASRAVLLAPVAEATHFARRTGSFIGLSGERLDGMLRRVRDELGGSFDAVDVRDFAHAIDARALVMHDPEDAEVPFAHGLGIASAWPEAHFEVLTDLGHRRLLRDPSVVARTVSFLTR